MLVIHIDASYDPKTKEAGLAFHIQAGAESISRKYYLAQIADNHVAEFQTLILLLDYLKEIQTDPNQLIQIKSDSKILVASIAKRYVKSPQYQPYFNIILQEMTAYPLLFVDWVAEKFNRGADQLAKHALRQQGKVIQLNEETLLHKWQKPIQD